MAKSNLTGVAQFDGVKAREIDFVTRFSRNWKSLQEILGIMRPVEKAAGTKLKSYIASLVLQDSVGEGEEIPYSRATVTPVAYADLTLEKYAKAVSIEAVDKYGAAVAVQKTDEAFLNELQGNVLDRFYTFIQTGTLTANYSTFQMAVAMAIGKVVDKFKQMRRDTTSIVVFVNTLDAYQYLGAADITIQTQNGLTYVQNFLGAQTVILSSEIPTGTVIATPSDNIVLYYVDPANSDFQSLGLNYTVEGETNLIGFHANGNYNTAVGESFALMGLTLWAEYLDAIAVVTVDANPLNGVTVSPEQDSTDFWGTTAGQMQSGLTVGSDKITGTLKYLSSGQLVTDWGAGYFMALKFSGFDASATSVKVGLQPSAGSGLVEILTDPDKNGVFKITDKNRQKFCVLSTAEGHRTMQTFDLSQLVLEN